METFNQRRISDVSFVIDENLNVLDGNRSFLRLFSVANPKFCLSDFMSGFDKENFLFFLNNFQKKSDEAAKNPYFIANLFPRKATSLSCLLYISANANGTFSIDVKELSYSKILLDKALLESREYRSLLQNFDAYYFIYDGAVFTLKNTKDSTNLFEGGAGEFEKYFSDNFQLNKNHFDTSAQLATMIADSLRFTSNKIYKMLKENKELVTVRTLQSATRDRRIILGSIDLGGEKTSLAYNLYSDDKDGLTGLYNKKSITELASKKINESKNPVSMIVLDVDKFKEFNDSYGHAFGDKVLTVVSNCIKDAIKGIGIAGRIGGDEFLIILDKTAEDDIRTVTRNIRTEIQWSIASENPSSVVTCSMGIARHPMNASNYDELFALADKCLYIAKSKGRNCYIIYKPELHDQMIVVSEKKAAEINSGVYFGKCADSEVKILTFLGNSQFKDAVRELAEYMEINCLSVYDLCGRTADGGYPRIFYAEKIPLDSNGWIEKSDFRQKYFSADGDYFKYFNSQGFLHLDNTIVFGTIDKTKHEMYRDNGIASTLEVIAENGGKPRILVCFDLFKPSRTFPKEKVIFAITASRLISAKLG